MTELRLDRITLPVADLGEPNPLPSLTPTGPPKQLPPDLTYGHVPNVLPYLLLDGYGRERAERELDVVVLANERLRATFLPGCGGRLLSLVDTENDRELLYRNEILQPANFGLADAWFAGGVEWNIGTTGHTPLTCAPLFAARVTGPDGVPALRMWEWERMRRVWLQLDAWLPPGGDLHVLVRLRNPHDADVPMYWWSNIAVSSADDVRVLAPARQAYRFDYDGTLSTTAVPEFDGTDRTYAARNAYAADFFYDLPDGQPWIAAVDGSGRGLVQTSTARLRGRKQFVWGTNQGARRWQDWLGGAYQEIQAGLARTQLEHVPMPAHACWIWLETYGPIEVDPAVAHGPWERACAAVADRLAPLDEGPTDWLDEPPAEILTHGSGWGALELHRGLACPPGLWFGAETLGPHQEPWLTLLHDGALPDRDPVSYLVDPAWRELLEASSGDGWARALHLGVMRHHAGDHEGAAAAWTRSAEIEPTAWALRNLAAVEPERAAELHLAAHRLAPELLPLTVETLEALLAAGRAADVLSLVDELPVGTGRVALAEARAAVATGDLDRARRLLDDGITVPNLAEGDTALGDLWFAAHATAPLPARYDFRMRP